MADYDNNYDASMVAVYNEDAQESTPSLDLDALLTEGNTKEKWDDIRKLVVIQVKFGLEESLRKGLYNDQVVKTALVLLKQADKSFDEDAAAEITTALEAFRNANKVSLRKHKDEAIEARVQ